MRAVVVAVMVTTRVAVAAPQAQAVLAAVAMVERRVAQAQPTLEAVEAVVILRQVHPMAVVKVVLV